MVYFFYCNRKRFIGYSVSSKSTLLEIVREVPQGSILRPLLFLLYISDLPQASKLLDPIIFAYDTNLFYSGKDIHSLFSTVNNELSTTSHWFNRNMLSLNADKTKFTLFHMVRQKENIPLVLPTLKIKQYPYNVKRPYQVFRSLIRWTSNMEKSYKSYWEQNIKKSR